LAKDPKHKDVIFCTVSAYLDDIKKKAGVSEESPPFHGFQIYKNGSAIDFFTSADFDSLDAKVVKYT